MPDFCTTTPTIRTINKSDSCKRKILITALRWQRARNIDLANIPVNADGCAIGMPMLNGELWHSISIDALKADWTWEYNLDEGYYNNTLAIDLSGFDKEKKTAICDALNFCDLVFYATSTDCKERIGGIENYTGIYDNSFKSEIGGHSGAIGNAAEASNLVTFNWASYCEPELVEIGIANLPTAP